MDENRNDKRAVHELGYLAINQEESFCTWTGEK